MILYRPVGLEELRLVHDSRMRRFPPRLPEQPIFYPVLRLEYARRIARDWNTRSGAGGGFVLRFEIDDAYGEGFARHVVGAKEHEELWVPAEELSAFNDHIRGPMEVVDAYFAETYRGAVGRAGVLEGLDAARQFTAICSLSPEEADRVVGADRAAVDLNLHFWRRRDFTREGIPTPRRDEVLARIAAGS